MIVIIGQPFNVLPSKGDHLHFVFNSLFLTCFFGVLPHLYVYLEMKAQRERQTGNE